MNTTVTAPTTVTWFRLGEFVTTPAITPDMVQALFADAHDSLERLRQTPISALAAVLDRVGQKLANPQHPVRQRILEQMPALLSFSPEMIAAGLDAIVWILRYDNLMKRLAVDLDDPDYIDRFVWNPRFGGYLRATPKGVVAHVSASNVFVSAVDTLVQGIMTKNANVLKMSSFDPVFPLLFAQVLQECDVQGLITPSIALLPFKGGDQAIEAVIKQQADLIVVYGGQETVEVYRSGRGLHTDVLEFGPKYSLAVLDRTALTEDNRRAVADELARDFSMWEQAACSSPHSVFVYGQETAQQFAQTLAQALDAFERVCPQAPINMHEQTEITRTRELARVEQALGQAELLIPAVSDQRWTVVLQKAPVFKVSCQHRTAFVVAIDSDEDLYATLAPQGAFIQSVGILADSARLFALADRLVASGADRITAIGHMHRRKHGTPHDATRGLAHMVRWVSIGHELPLHEHWDFLPDAQRHSAILAKLNQVLRVARSQSPFYRERLPAQDLLDLSALAGVALLQPAEFRAHLPPQGAGLLTAPLGNSISFASGGTTGAPKFVYRTVDENRRNAASIGKSMGLGLFAPGDVVANLFFAGNMWASFMSVNQAAEALGVHLLPIGGHIAMENIVAQLRAFPVVDGVVSIPSVLVGIAQYVQQQGIRDLRIRKIGYAGEHLTAAARAYLAEVLHAEVIRSVSYAINDTGNVGYQCPNSTGSIHHLDDSLHWLEIVDPATGHPVPQGQEGDIVVTNIDRTLMPVIRYAVGDRGRIIPGPCPCGRTSLRFELLGRSDEVLVLGADNITVESVAQCVAVFAELSPHFSVCASSAANGLDELLLEVEAHNDLCPERAQELAAQLQAQLLGQRPVLATNVRNQSVAMPVVRVLPPGALPRNPKTGKIRRMVDKRSHG